MPERVSSPHSELIDREALFSAVEYLSSRLTLNPNPVELENAADIMLTLNAEVRRLEEQLEAYRAALQTIADKDLTAHQTRSGAHAYRTTRQFAREVLNPATNPEACDECDGKGVNTGWPHTTCPACEGSGVQNPASSRHVPRDEHGDIEESFRNGAEQT